MQHVGVFRVYCDFPVELYRQPQHIRNVLLAFWPWICGFVCKHASVSTYLCATSMYFLFIVHQRVFVIKWKTKHTTLGTVPKSNRKSIESISLTHIYTWFCWLCTGNLIKSGGVMLVLRAQTSPFHKMMKYMTQTWWPFCTYSLIE